MLVVPVPRFRALTYKLRCAYKLTDVDLFVNQKVAPRTKKDYFIVMGKRKHRPCAHCGKQTRDRHAKFCGMECYRANQDEQRYQTILAGQSTAKEMKTYLIRNFGDQCMSGSCHWDFNAQKIKCELEHKDGNSSNNTIDNCILICPNCHSLTPTYKAKNKGNGRHSRRLRYQEGKSY